MNESIVMCVSSCACHSPRRRVQNRDSIFSRVGNKDTRQLSHNCNITDTFVTFKSVVTSVLLGFRYQTVPIAEFEKFECYYFLQK